jgi:hypothetical protein
LSALGYGAGALARVLMSPRTWRVVDLIIGIVMLALAIKLIRGQKHRARAVPPRVGDSIDGGFRGAPTDEKRESGKHDKKG